MSAVHALNGHHTTTHPASPDSPDTVKNHVDTKPPGRGWSRTTSTPRSPAASCGPTPAASPTATSRP